MRLCPRRPSSRPWWGSPSSRANSCWNCWGGQAGDNSTPQQTALAAGKRWRELWTRTRVTTGAGTPRPTSCSVAVPAVARPQLCPGQPGFEAARSPEQQQVVPLPGQAAPRIRRGLAGGKALACHHGGEGLGIKLVSCGQKQHCRQLTGQRRQQAFEVDQALGQSTARQHQQPLLLMQAGRQGWVRHRSIHHGIPRRQGGNAMATQSPRREAITHHHEAAASVAHQPPFPRVPFAAFAAVIGISHGCGSPVGSTRSSRSWGCR